MVAIHGGERTDSYSYARLGEKTGRVKTQEINGEKISAAAC